MWIKLQVPSSAVNDTRGQRVPSLRLVLSVLTGVFDTNRGPHITGAALTADDRCVRMGIDTLAAGDPQEDQPPRLGRGAAPQFAALHIKVPKN